MTTWFTRTHYEYKSGSVLKIALSSSEKTISLKDICFRLQNDPEKRTKLMAH